MVVISDIIVQGVQMLLVLLLAPLLTGYVRKIKEWILSYQLTQKYPGIEGRDKILEWYLNTIFYGHFAFGVEAAAQTYFNKHVEDLTLAYNKARQASITNEILDIVGGAEALQASLDDLAREVDRDLVML